ncbi:MAG: hypothetical protein IIY93_05045 [Clostridia bacterium]|nr:hypothetical protein [Clostridia bacterium]MBQ1555812.1 hypothetical protein [Clostridia bacterium]
MYGKTIFEKDVGNKPCAADTDCVDTVCGDQGICRSRRTAALIITAYRNVENENDEKENHFVLQYRHQDIDNRKKSLG